MPHAPDRGRPRATTRLVPTADAFTITEAGAPPELVDFEEVPVTILPDDYFQGFGLLGSSLQAQLNHDAFLQQVQPQLGGYQSALAKQMENDRLEREWERVRSQHYGYALPHHQWMNTLGRGDVVSRDEPAPPSRLYLLWERVEADAARFLRWVRARFIAVGSLLMRRVNPDYAASNDRLLEELAPLQKDVMRLVLAHDIDIWKSSLDTIGDDIDDGAPAEPESDGGPLVPNY